MVRTQLYLDEALHRRLREIAKRQGRTVSDLMREAVSRSYGAPAVEERLAGSPACGEIVTTSTARPSTWGTSAAIPV